jgi:FAD/FMN-containing dehydrogenase
MTGSERAAHAFDRPRPAAVGPSAHAAKLARLEAALAAAARDGTLGIGLAKRTSNLFRDRARRGRPRIDLSGFDAVIRVDPAGGVVEAEGMVPYVALADATLAHGMMPAVVPQLKSITLGGAVAGVGIEASSFREGLVHETVTAMEVLTGDGRIVTCTPDNEHRDLYFGLPNSYGTLGYALAVTARLVPVRPYVALEHVRYSHPDACFAAMAAHCSERRLDFVDGVVFAPDEIYLTLGRFVREAPATSDYGYENIYYRSIRERPTDWLTVRDYLWRWDTDWFWCSRNVGAQHPLIRRLLGRKRLNSLTWQKVMRWNSRWGVTRAWARLRGLHPESVIQDVDIPLARAAEFLAFLHDEIGILPVWLCPIRAPDPARRFPLYPLAPGTAYVNFGFWDVVVDAAPRPAGHRNRMIERKVAELGGLKSLYSDSFYAEDEFWAAYDRAAYAALKAKYDPSGTLPDLYAKCVERR